MADNTISLSAPAKKPKNNWSNSKLVNTALTVAGIGVSTTIVPQQNRVANYIPALVIGSAFGYYSINNVFDFDGKYLIDDKYAEIKGGIEGAIIGASISASIIAFRDDKLSHNNKMIIAGMLGALLAYEITDSEWIVKAHGDRMIEKDIVGALVGGLIGSGLYAILNKTINNKK